MAHEPPSRMKSRGAWTLTRRDGSDRSGNSFAGAGCRGLLEQALHQAFEPFVVTVPDRRGDLPVLVDHKQGGKPTMP